MIDAIILDVDGVIVGEKIGFNSPYSHQAVINVLKQIRQKNIPIILCTAKPYKSILEIIKSASLNNLHIADAGGVIYDPIDNAVLEELFIEKQLAKNILQTCLDNNIYTEFYTRDNYFIQENQESFITPKHAHVLQFMPIKVPSLIQETNKQNITKIMPIALDHEDKKRVIEILKPFENLASISWGLHPYAGHLQFCIITNKNTSKKTAVEKIIKSKKINFENILAVGDSTSDWKFMELCGYVATLENGTSELKNLIKIKGEKHFFIGKSVDENGILDIFEFFKLS
ncbi:MAG TPA: HAD family hydrolase [Patescibacteria group bacterium]